MEYLPNKIYVKGLRTGFDKKHVRDIFGRYGNIVSIFCGTHGFAFVEFDSEEAATKAIEHENKQERDGITMKVCYAQKRQPRPDHKANTRLLSSSGEREDPLPSPVRSPMKPRRARHHEDDREHRTGARDRDRDRGKGKDGDRHTDRDRDRDRNRERVKDRNRPDVRLRRSQELPHRRSMPSNQDGEPDRSEGNQAARQRVNPSSSNWSQRNEPFYSFENGYEPPQHPSSPPPPIQLPPSPSPQYRPPSPPSQLPPSFVTLFESMQPSDLLSAPFPLSQHTSSYVPQDTSPFITHDSPLFLPQGAVPQGTGTSPSLKDLNPAQLVALLALINRVGVTQVARAALLTALASAQSGEAAPSSNAVDSNSLPPPERSFGNRPLSPLGLEEMSWSTDKSANVQNFSTASSATKETRPTSSPPSYPPPPAYPSPSPMDNSRPLEPPPEYHTKTLLIRNCPLQTPQEYINMFSVYGTISNLRGISENRQRGDVFIEFEQEDAATLTVAQMDGITLKGHTVHVSFASRELLSRSYESSEAKRRSPDRHTRRGNRSHFSEPSREERSHRRYDDRDRRHPRDSPTAREKSERKHGKHEHRDRRHHSDSSTTREDDKSGKDRERHYRESSTTRKERHSSVQTGNGAAVMDQPSQDVRETNHNTPPSPQQEDEKKETNVLRRKRRLRKVVSVEQALPDITATLYKEEDLALSENNTNGLDTVGVGRWMCKRCGFKNNIRTECEVCEWTSDLKKKQTRKKEQKTTPTQLHNIANQEHDEHQTEGQQKNHTHNNNIKPTKDSSAHGDNSVNDKFAEAKQPVSSLASLTAKGLKHRILNNALSVPPSERDEKCTYCHQCHASFSIHNHQACISCTSCNLCYCFSCLRQHYQTIFPNLDSVAQSSPTNNGTSLHAVTETSSWSCPKCKNACTCSSCHTANGSASKTSPPTKTTPKLRIKKAGVEQTNKRQQDNKEEPPVKRRRRFSGKITLPFTREGTTVLSLGKVVYDRSHFHNTKYIWPVGFTSIREFNSSAPGGRSVYTCEIVDNGGPRPEFRITTKDDPSLKVNGKSASAAWKQLWEIFRSPHMSGHISGPALFGFSPQVKAAIENLPNAEKCANYEFVYREVDQKKRSRSTSKGNKPEKTERKVKRRRTSTARQAMKEERNEMKAKEESPSSSTNKAGTTTQTQPEADQLITLGPDEWMCTACTYINKGRDKVVCGMCATSWFGWGNESQRAPLPQNNVSAPSKRRTASLKALLTMGDVHEYTSQQSPVKQRSRSRSDEPSSRTGTRRGRETTSTTRRGPGRPRKSETMAKTSKRQKNEEREEREEEEDDQKEEDQLGFETEEEEEEEEDWSSDLDGIEEVEEWAMIAAEKADDDDNNSSEEAEEEEDDLSESDRDGDETNANEEHSIVYYERNDEDDDGFVIYERKVERPPDPTHRLPPSSQRHSPSTPSSSTATTSTSFATTGFSPDPTLLQTLVFAAESTANNNP